MLRQTEPAKGLPESLTRCTAEELTFQPLASPVAAALTRLDILDQDALRLFDPLVL
jgi:hypothetical protein